MTAADSGEALVRLRRELAASETPSWTALREYLEQVRLREESTSNQRFAEVWTRALAPAPPVCPAHLVSLALQVRLLRLRDTERVVQYGTQLLDKHSRKLDVEEREWHGQAVRSVLAVAAHCSEASRSCKF